jgi:hypothetical protein
MTKTPSTEVRAVQQQPANGGSQEAAADTSGEPAWVDELRGMLQDQGERIAKIEKRLQHLDGSFGVLANSYKIQAQELQLLRQACPACDADAIVTSEG